MRKKPLFIILCIIMVTAMFIGLPSVGRAISDGDSSIIRVRLSIGSVTSFSFTTHGSYGVGGAALADNSTYTAKISSGNITLSTGKTVIASGSSLYIGQTGGTGNTIRLNNDAYGARSYQGDMSFSINGGKLLLVNHIDLEQYLYGVVPYEMSNTWHIEALKAQAVAARNYAVRKMGNQGSYDITDLSSQDQAYKGYNANYTNTIAAVDTTAGQVMTYDGEVINAYYSASNGGWTELPYHRWGGGANWPYYRVDYDPYDIANPSSRYETITIPTVMASESALTTSTNCSGTINPGNAVKLIKKAILDSGQLTGVTSVDDFTLTGVTGLYTHTYDTDSRQDHRRTQNFDHTDVPDLPDPNLCMDKVRAMGAFTVSVGETAAAVTDIDFDLRELNSTGSYPAFFAASLGLFVVEPVYDGEGAITAFNLSMRRFGHALGLSQRGAQQRVKPIENGGAGQTYDQVLQFYYPGTTLQTLRLVNPIHKVSGVSLDRTAVSMEPGRVLTLAATITPSTALDKSVSWASDNDAVATVADGVVTAAADGTAQITVTTADGGYTANCTVTVKTGVIISNMYTIGDDTVSGVKDNTPAASFLANLDNDPANLRVYTIDGGELTSGIVGTGMTVVLFKDGAEADRLTVIVRGDANGDGIIDILDYTAVRFDILDFEPLQGAFKAGADTNMDGIVDILDYTGIRFDILGFEKIN